jgi:hypothetical protein
VPGANGCAEPLSLVIDPAVDLQTGLPAAGGKNTAVLSGTLEQAGVKTVRAQGALPDLGRCVKTASEKAGEETVYHGSYFDSGCTYEDPHKSSPYEWLPGPGTAKTFSAGGKAVTLETVGKSKVTCTESIGAGEYTGTKSATLGLSLSGCKLVSSKEACQSAGSGSGVIVANGLEAALGFIKDEATENGVTVSLGWDLKHEPSVVSAECGAAKEALNVTGSVIAPITVIDKMAASYVLKAKATAGHQEPEQFEEGPKDTLSATLGAGAAEQAGLTSAVKVLNGEKLEFKALAE